VLLRGAVDPRGYLYIRAVSSTPLHLARAEALFDPLRLEKRRSATLNVRLIDGQIVFTLHYPDGTSTSPARSMHSEGPGPMAALPSLPPHYADSPRQALATFLEAMLADDGKTVCELWTPAVRAAFAAEERTPCWAAAAARIYDGGGHGPLFRRAEIVKVGHPNSRFSNGTRFTALPATLNVFFLTGLNGSIVSRESSVVFWFTHTAAGWRIAQDPFLSIRLGAAPPGGPQDPNSTPGLRSPRT
jgi:hypothetical protein